MKRFLKSFTLLLCSSFLVATTGWAAEVMKLSFSRTASSLGNEMQVTVTEGGDVQESATWTAIETNSKRSSANTGESTDFFNGVTGGFAPVSAGYPMVRSQFKLDNDDNYWEMWIPVTLTREIAFDAILPEVYAVTAGAGAQTDQKVFNFGFKIYRGEQSIDSTAETVLDVSGATDKLKDALYNTVGVNLDSPTRLSEGQYTFVLKLSAKDCQGGSYSGIKGLSLIDYSTLPIADWSASFNEDNITTGWITGWGDTSEQFDVFVDTPNDKGAKVTSSPKGHPWVEHPVSSPFSIALYIDTSAVAVTDKPAMLIGLGNTGNHIALVKTAADTLAVYKSKSQVASLKIQNSNLALNGSYHFVAFGSNATESFLFVDGEKVTGATIANPNAGLQIGAMYQGLDTNTYVQGYNMIVDEVRGYNHLLTTPELTALSNAFPMYPNTVQPIEDVLAINFANNKADIGSSETSADAIGFVKYVNDIAYDGRVVPNQWIKTDAGKQNDWIDVSSTASNTYQLKWQSNDATWTATDNGGVLTGGTLVERLTHGYLDNGNSSQNKVQLKGLPTTGYDVAIIFSGDSSNRTGKNSRVSVNNRVYTYNAENKLVEDEGDWGVRFRSSSLVEGENVMFIPQRVDSELTIDTFYSDTGRGTIAAVQIFLHKGAIVPVLSMEADTDKSGALSWKEIVAVVGGRTDWKISGAVTISLDADVDPALTALTLNPVNASGDKLTITGTGSLWAEGAGFALSTAIPVTIKNVKVNPRMQLAGSGEVTFTKADGANDYGISLINNGYTGTLTVDGGQQITNNGELSIPFTVGANGAKLHSNDSDWTVSSKISGSGSLTIESPDRTIYVTSNTTDFSGDVILKSGTLYLDKEKGSVGNVFNNANTTLTVKSGAIFKTHLTQNGTSDYSRGLILEPGAQVINHEGHMNYNGDLVVNNGGDANSTSTYQLVYNKTADFKGVISGQGTLNLTVGNTDYSPHTVKISNENNTFSGTYHINPNNGNYTQLILEANGKIDDASVKMSKGQFKLVRDNTSIVSLSGTAGTVTSNDSTERTLTLNGDSDVRNLTFTNVNLVIASGETFVTPITKATVAADAKVKVVLTADQKLTGLTLNNVTVDGGTVVFLDIDGTTVLQSANSNEYAGAQECTYTVAEEGGAWNKNPGMGDAITLAFGEITDRTLDASILPQGVTSLAKITITGANASVAANLVAYADTIESATAWSLVGTAQETTIAGVISGEGQVKIAAGLVKFTNTNTYTGGTDIATDATLTAPTNGLGSGALTGAGTLVVNGYPAIATVRDSLGAAEWKGTYVNTADNTFNGNSLGAVGNANSIVEFTGTNTGYLQQAGSMNAALKVTGSITFNDGWSSGGGYTFNGALLGDGTLATQNAQTDVLKFLGETKDFAGTVTVEGGHCIAFGEQADDDSQQGKIVIAKPVTIAASKTWTAANGIDITANGSLAVNGSVTSAITNNGSLAVNGSVTNAITNNGTMAVAGSVTGAVTNNGTTTISGSVTGAITNAGTLVYGVDTTATNTFTGNGEIVVAEGVELKMTSATLDNFTGSYTVKAGAVLTLLAGKEGNVTVEDEGTLNVVVAGKDIPYRATASGAGMINITLADGTVLSGTANYKPGLTGDCTWLEFLFEGEGDQRLSNGGTFGHAIRGEDNGTWTFVDVGVTPARQALQIHNKYPWTNTAPAFSSLETWSASFFAKMPTTEGGILMGFGTTVGNNPGFIALVRGKGTDKVLLVSGTSSGRGYNILADFTVPNAESAYHLYTFVRTVDGVNIYLDGEPWAPYGKTVTVGNGFQIGSLHGGYEGFTYSGELTDYSGLTLTRGGSGTDTNGAVDMLRIYRFALSPEDVQTLASEYTYVSPSGSYSREITVDAEWTADNAWTNDKNATTVSEPPKGSVTLTATSGVEEMLTMTVNASEAKTFEALTLQGTGVELVGAEGSKKLSVTGLTKVICDATVDCGVIAMTGPVRVASNATLTLKVSEALLDSVVQNAVIGKYTYHLTGAAEGTVVIDNAPETYNGWSVEIEQDNTKSWVLTMTRANWYVSIDANGVTTWRAGNAVETAVEVAAAPEVSTNQPIYITTAGDAPVTLPSGRTDNVTVNGTGRVTLNAAANGTTIGELAINDTAMAAITPALTVNQMTVAADATLGYAAANEVWTISSALPGSTKIEIVSGTVKVTAANGGYTGQITVAEGATLASGTTATCPFGKGEIVNYGTVVLSGGQLPPTSGNGDVEISGLGEGQNDQLASIAGELTCTGTLTVAANQSVRLWHHQNDFTEETPAINGPSIRLGSGSTIVAGDGYADATMTIPANVTLSGSGTIDVRVILADGAIIDATNGAVTATDVALPAEDGTVTVRKTTHGEVLLTSDLVEADAEKFVVETPVTNWSLVVTKNGLVYVAAPATGDVEFSAEAQGLLNLLAQAAASEGVTSLTIEGVTLSGEGDDAVKADIAGLELFDTVPVLIVPDGENGTGVAMVNYVFGINSVTVNAEGKIVVTASVDRLSMDNFVEPIEGEDAGEGEGEMSELPRPTFVNGVTVVLYNGNTVLGSTTIDEASTSEVTIESIGTYDSIFNPPAAAQDEGESATPSTPSSQTLQLTIKAAKP